VTSLSDGARDRGVDDGALVECKGIDADAMDGFGSTDEAGGVGAETSGPKNSGVGRAHRRRGGGRLGWRMEAEVGVVGSIGTKEGGDVPRGGEEASGTFVSFDAEVLEEERLREDVL
jgi:hypothetical protein